MPSCQSKLHVPQLPIILYYNSFIFLIILAYLLAPRLETRVSQLEMANQVLTKKLASSEGQCQELQDQQMVSLAQAG